MILATARDSSIFEHTQNTRFQFKTNDTTVNTHYRIIIILLLS